MPTKIVLFDAQGYWLKKTRDEMDQVVLPLGLMYLASYARSKLGDALDIKIYHTMVDFDNDAESIAACIRRERPDVVGIRGMTRYQKEFAQVARLARENSSALIVAGGPYASSDEQAGLLPEIDIAVLDEGEITFTEILDRFQRGQPLDGILGTAVRRDGVVHRAPKRPFLDSRELEALPFPAYDLIDMDKYATQLSYGYNRRRQGVIYTSRGCPYRCDFCHVLFGKKFRERGPESLLAEFTWLYDQWNVRDFYVVDDIFNLQKERAVEFFRKLSKSHMGGNIRIYFVNGLRGDRIDKEFIDAAVEAGAVWLAYAVETASPRLQKQIQKHLKIDKVKRVIEYSYQKGVAVIYWGMLGIDTETIEEAQSTVDLLCSMPPSTIPMLFSMKPYPGTEAYAKLRAKEKALDESLKFQFQDTGSEYHSFAGLMKKDERYFDVLKTWVDQAQSPERMKTCTKNLMRIGNTDEDIRIAYKLLYRKLPKRIVDELIQTCRHELAAEGPPPPAVWPEIVEAKPENEARTPARRALPLVASPAPVASVASVTPVASIAQAAPVAPVASIALAADAE
ncbi:B12-binding domain-containing radical SAM protein [Pendulispora albinea]|uniref:B12-binding domain-containing radical SAM protein n=1 Tax=Pendulispora albinea TaxID=2741071 RepID=A0ABZ2MAI3_9BACT